MNSSVVMKKYAFLAGIAGLVLVFGLALAGCKPEPDPNPFEGTWVNEKDEDQTLTFDDSTWIMKADDVGYAKGTYDYDGDKGEFTLTHLWDDDDEEWYTATEAGIESPDAKGTGTISNGKLTFKQGKSGEEQVYKKS
ncbi:MAG: hypothetical protein LBO76_04305 [Treponema sp.]|jgi:hypothetical protein|nr:hypothetical protein [Treponema sp.]